MVFSIVAVVGIEICSSLLNFVRFQINTNNQKDQILLYDNYSKNWADQKILYDDDNKNWKDWKILYANN